MYFCQSSPGWCLLSVYPQSGTVEHKIPYGSVIRCMFDREALDYTVVYCLPDTLQAWNECHSNVSRTQMTQNANVMWCKKIDLVSDSPRDLIDEILLQLRKQEQQPDDRSALSQITESHLTQLLSDVFFGKVPKMSPPNCFVIGVFTTGLKVKVTWFNFKIVVNGSGLR